MKPHSQFDTLIATCLTLTTYNIVDDEAFTTLPDHSAICQPFTDQVLSNYWITAVTDIHSSPMVGTYQILCAEKSTFPLDQIIRSIHPSQRS